MTAIAQPWGMPGQKLVLASNNAGKLHEFRALLEPLGWQVVPQGELGVSAAEEPHATFVENALAKARHAAQATGLPALADDSGLCVPALNDAPGVHSARYSALHGGESGDAANNAHLIQQLKGVANRQARYIAVLALMRHPQDPQPLLAEGVWHGEVRDVPQGQNGFGYDPHFWLPELACTVAELSDHEKNDRSHRGQAMRALLQALRSIEVTP